MPTLNSVTETLIRVNYYSLDAFIQEVTGQKDYECVSGEEWGNDSSHRFIVDGELNIHDQGFWNSFKEGKANGQYRLGTILDGLCADKHIPPGKYLIGVSW